MEILSESFGSIFVYLFKTSLWSVGAMFLAGFMLAWFAVGYIRGVNVIVAGQVERHRGGWWRLVLGLIVILVLAGAHGLGFVFSYLPVLIFGMVCGVFVFLFHWWAVGGIAILLSFCIFLGGLLVWTFHVYTGKTAIMEVRVRSTEKNEDEMRISLIVKDLKKGTENTYFVFGDKWGISANVVLFDDWVVFLGGKTYYRVDSIVGATEDVLDRRVVDEFSQPMWLQIDQTWESLEQNEDKFLGIRAVYENIVLKTPVVGRVYTIYIDNDGALVPEIKDESGD